MMWLKNRLLWPLRLVSRLLDSWRARREKRKFDAIVAKFKELPIVDRMRKPLNNEETLAVMERLDQLEEGILHAGYPSNLKREINELRKGTRKDFDDLNA
jgi:hypothetical protein